MSAQPEIFFHVGMMRTGTTYLQNSVFPFFKGLHYIHKRHYYLRDEIMRTTTADTYLISYELGLREWEEEVRRFAVDYPDAQTIVVLRQQHEWLVSEYKRQVKNGMVVDFADFWNFGNDDAQYARSDLLYTEHIASLSAHFTKDPIILLYEDFRMNGPEFIKQLANIMGATYDENDIVLNPRHTSYSDKQLKALLAVMKFINIRREQVFKNEVLHRIQRLLKDLVRYGVLYGSLLIPDFLLSRSPLVPEKTLRDIENDYAEDWADSKQRASK